MTKTELIDELAIGAKRKIECNSSLHRELSKLNDYEFSEVAMAVEEKTGMQLVLDVFNDIYEVM